MKIQQILDKIDQDVLSAYNTVGNKGGTVPQNKTLKNLSNSVASIPQGPSTTDWGEIIYYPYEKEYEAYADGVEVYSIDSATLESFMAQNPPAEPPDAYFTHSEQPRWGYEGENGWIYIADEDFAATTGIECELTSSDGASIQLYSKMVVHEDEPTIRAEFTSRQQYENFPSETSDGKRQVGEDFVITSAIKEIHLGTQVTSIPDSFASSCSKLEVFDMSHSTITSIGNYNLLHCYRFNGNLDFSHVTTIGNFVLNGCHVFNKPLTFSPNLTSIGNEFMRDCRAYNHPIILPDSLTTIQDSFFLNSSDTFNQPVQLPSALTSIGSGFMRGNQGFNQPITIPSTVTTIKSNFLALCASFNYPITIPSNVTTIDDGFLGSCSAFNSTVTIPSSVTKIGKDFLNGCSTFNQTLTIPNSVTIIGKNFLVRCTSFNQALTLPTGLTSLGDGFLMNADSMVSTVNVGNLSANINEQLSWKPFKNTFSTTNSSAPAYTTGMSVTGATASAWATKFPNSATSPYRKIVVV